MSKIVELTDEELELVYTALDETGGNYRDLSSEDFSGSEEDGEDPDKLAEEYNETGDKMLELIKRIRAIPKVKPYAKELKAFLAEAYDEDTGIITLDGKTMNEIPEVGQTFRLGNFILVCVSSQETVVKARVFNGL